MIRKTNNVTRREITRAKHGHHYLASASSYPLSVTPLPLLANGDILLADLVPENCVLDQVKIFVQGPPGRDFSGLVANGFIVNHDKLDWVTYTAPTDVIARPFRTGAIGTPWGEVTDLRLYWHTNTFAQEKLGVTNMQYVALVLPNIASYLSDSHHLYIGTYYRPFSRGVDQTANPW